MKNEIERSTLKTIHNINTGYSASEAVIYDIKRFSDPKGKLFNKFEMYQLEHILFNLPPKQRILEVGCGTGRFILKCLEASHEVHGLDLSPSMLNECRKKTSQFENVYFYMAEGAKLPFKNNEFDFIYSIRTLNQVSSKSYAIDMIHEIIRVCSNDGIILIEFVNKQSLTLQRNPSVRLSIKDIKLIITKYRNIEIKDISGLLFFPQTLLNLTPNFLLNFFEKTDMVFSNLFPMFSTRCYLILYKKFYDYGTTSPKQMDV